MNDIFISENVNKNTYYDENSSFARLYDIWGLKKIKGQVLPKGKASVLEINTKEMSFISYGFCNDINGSINIELENDIEFNKISATKMNCNDINLETFYIENLKDVNSYQLKGPQLYFLDINDKVLLEFVKLD